MQYAIEIKNLCKQYPKFALQSVSFTLPMGYIMGFIGENGAGKTTVMKSMLHLVRPDSGTVLLLGQDATKENAALKQQIGVVLDTTKLSTEFHHAGCASDVETGLFQLGRGTISTVSGTISLAGKEKVQGIFYGHEEKVGRGSCSCPSSKAFDFG